ncbi:sensor histidine kinase [Methylobacter marinus]|uniref:sensor histidine kinase n=1 Tax=Methylobacter marinus TaxID=34058 RepID=UPI0003A3C159|nr:ATP-binding protein [Methylobacter marinus]
MRKSDPDLRDRLDQGLAIVKATGEYDRLYRKWLGLYETSTFPVRYVAWGALAATSLLALLGLWTWQLRRQVALHTAEMAQAYTAVQASYLEDGPRWFHGTYSPDFDDEGQVRGFVGHVLDITGQKRAEEALKENDRRKDEFLAMLAHELRNPLAPIGNAVHIMKRSSLDETRLAWCSNVIERQVGRLVRLIDDLLNVSRISRGKIELKQEALDISTIVQRAVETSQPLIEAHRHDFTVQLPPESRYVEGDLVRLSQVISNLLNNAAKYTDAGGCISLTVEPADHEFLIRVRDNGHGIEPSALSSLFELFYQVDRTIDRSEGGLGIGLALVKILVAMHGGEVWATSAGRGQASAFIIRLPCLLQSALDSAPHPTDLKANEAVAAA